MWLCAACALTANVASIHAVIAFFSDALTKPLAALRKFCISNKSSAHALNPATSARPSGDMRLKAASSFFARPAPLSACSAHVLNAARAFLLKSAAPPFRSFCIFSRCSCILTINALQPARRKPFSAFAIASFRLRIQAIFRITLFFARPSGDMPASAARSFSFFAFAMAQVSAHPPNAFAAFELMIIRTASVSLRFASFSSSMVWCHAL